MKCPVYGKKATTRIYYCARCAAHVHVDCGKKHATIAHKR